MVIHCKADHRILIIPFFMLVLIISLSCVSQAAEDQILLNGRVKIIELSTNTVVVTDYEGKDYKFYIEDSEILDKFKDNRIKIGDDVNIKYKIINGKNIPFSFRRTAGC
ncbi:MAG TPA: hypothetical protein VK452_11180 [Dissulfurispiraceae bacterium]|nr:hypothetical protein [Dissulfurispiraceae bacterium]